MSLKIGGLPDKGVARPIRLEGVPRLLANRLVAKARLTVELARVRILEYAIGDRETKWMADGFWRRGAFRRPVFCMDMSRVKSFAPVCKPACAEISGDVRRG